MKTTIKFRKDGRVVIENRGVTEYHDGRPYQFDDCRVMIMNTDGYRREITEGDEGVLVTKDHVSKSGYEQAHLYENRDGVGGNMNSNIERLHGWRGTSDDIACYANGWRRVEEYREVSRGYGMRCVLSVDLMPNED